MDEAQYRGTAIFRDIRAWHGGTPNISRDVRAMRILTVFRSEGIIDACRTRNGKSCHAQRISRYVTCDKGEEVIGAGFMNPRRRKREAFKQNQLEALGEKAAREYLARL